MFKLSVIFFKQFFQIHQHFLHFTYLLSYMYQVFKFLSDAILTLKKVFVKYANIWFIHTISIWIAGQQSKQLRILRNVEFFLLN